MKTDIDMTQRALAVDQPRLLRADSTGIWQLTDNMGNQKTVEVVNDPCGTSQDTHGQLYVRGKGNGYWPVASSIFDGWEWSRQDTAPRLDGVGASAGSSFVHGVKVPPDLAAYIQANDRPLYEGELLRFRGCGKVLVQKLIAAGLTVHERGKREKTIKPWQKTRIQETLDSLRAKESRLIAKLEAVKQWLANCRQKIASVEGDLKEANDQAVATASTQLQIHDR